MLVSLFETGFTGLHTCIYNYSCFTIKLWCIVYIKGPTCKPSLTYIWITPLLWLHVNFNLLCDNKLHSNSSLKDALSAFKSARYFSPLKMNNIQPNAEAIDALKAFLFLNLQALLDRLKGELLGNLSKGSDFDPRINILHWWKQNQSALPCWEAAVCKVLLVQPSSAASERIFSSLKSSFSPHQQSSMQDYLKYTVSLMLQYNIC